MSENLESIQINLNSRYATCYVDDSKSNCIFNLGTIVVPLQHHIHMSVVNCSIPYSFYNINRGNNTLIYTILGIQKTILIDPGNYNANQLCSYLSSKMPEFTSIKYNSITNKITFTCGLEFSFDTSSTCLEMLGIINNNSSDGILTSDNCINLQTIESICVCSSFPTGNFSNRNVTMQDILCTLVIDTQPNAMIVYQNNGMKFSVNMYNNVINQISMKICDHKGQLIDLNGCNWNITIQLDVVDFVN